MSDKEKPLKFARFGLRILVYGNRVEITEGKKLIIPYSKIASVSIGSISRRLEIATVDGKMHKYAFFFSWKTRRCRDAIAERL